VAKNTIVIKVDCISLQLYTPAYFSAFFCRHQLLLLMRYYTRCVRTANSLLRVFTPCRLVLPSSTLDGKALPTVLRLCSGTGCWYDV